MPDTDPVIDDLALVDFIPRRARDGESPGLSDGGADPRPCGAEMTDLGFSATPARWLQRRRSDGYQLARRAPRPFLCRDFGALVAHLPRTRTFRRRRGDRGRGGDGLRVARSPEADHRAERDIRLVAMTAGATTPAISCASLDVIRGAKQPDCRLPAAPRTITAFNENDVGPYPPSSSCRRRCARKGPAAMLAGVAAGRST